MPLGQDQGSLEAHWGLDLDLAPMEPLPFTLVSILNKGVLTSQIH